MPASAHDPIRVGLVGAGPWAAGFHTPRIARAPGLGFHLAVAHDDGVVHLGDLDDAKQHVETLPDLPTQSRDPFLGAAQRLAQAVKDALGAQGSFVAMNNTVSQSVPHLHCHVVPRTKGDGLSGFFWPRVTYAEAEAESYAERLRAVLG